MLVHPWTFNILVLFLQSGQAQQFSDALMSPVWPNISTSCFNALNSTVKDCPGLLGDVSVNNERLRSDQLTALCTTACQSGLTSSRQTILKGCTGPSDVIHFYDSNVYPATYIVDRYIFTYGLSCRRDAVTGDFCDDLFMAWLNQSELTPDQDCSDCMLGIQQIQLNSPFGYDADFASDFQSMTSSCSKSHYQFTSPSAYTLTTATTPGASPSTLPTCATSYTVKAGDTCNSISSALNVSTYSVVNAGGLLPDCSNLVSNISLCLPSSCDLYRVQENDTCTSILSTWGLGVSATQFLAWNPNINGLCGNLYGLRGTQLCISPPGGNPPNITITTPLAVSIPTSPVPKPTNAPGESNTRCGQWYTVASGDTCEKVSVQQRIPLQDFYFLNPEIFSTNCSNLLLGLAYCVQAVGDLATYAGYPKTTNFITLASLSYSTLPVESFTEHGILSTVVSTSQSPLASGTVQNCAVYRNFQPPPPTLDQSDSTDVISFSTEYANNCVFISGSYQVSLGDLIAWNPSLAVPNGTCGDLQPGFSYCVSMNASTGELPASNGCLQVNRTDIPPGTDASCSCFTLISGCDNSSTYSCEDLAADFDISVNQLTSLNPWVTNNCDTGLYANLSNTTSRAVCVSDDKTAPASTTMTMTK